MKRAYSIINFCKLTTIFPMLIIFGLALINCGAVSTVGGSPVSEKVTSANLIEDETVVFEQVLDTGVGQERAAVVVTNVKNVPLSLDLAITGDPVVADFYQPLKDNIRSERPGQPGAIHTLFAFDAFVPAPGPKPVGLAWDGDGGQLWVSDATQQRIYAVDHKKGKVLFSMFTDASSPRDLAWQDGALWIADQGRDRLLYKVQPDRKGGITLSVIPSPGKNSAPCGLAYGDGSLWVSHGCMAQDSHDNIYRINPSNGKVLDVFDAPGQQPEGLAFHNGMLWNVDSAAGVIYKIDPNNPSNPKTVAVPARTKGRLIGLTHDGTSLWVSDDLNIHQVRL